MHAGPVVDWFVTENFDICISRPDALRKVEQPSNGPETKCINGAISDQRGRILRAERDDDAEVLEVRDLKRIREAAISQTPTVSLSSGIVKVF